LLNKLLSDFSFVDFQSGVLSGPSKKILVELRRIP